MRCQGVSPNSITFACILKACGNLGAVEKGKNIHEEILREGYLENDCMVGNALVEMYAKCGDLAKAQDVFDNLNVWDVIGFTSLITGYDQHGYGDKALKCFEQMRNKGLSPDAMTFTYILKACGSMGAAEMGKEIHADIVKEGLLVHDNVLGNALVNMYANFLDPTRWNLARHFPNCTYIQLIPRNMSCMYSLCNVLLYLTIGIIICLLRHIL